MLRTLRRKFGISAPRVAIRTHVPWYVRWVAMLGVATLAVAGGWWTYNFGKQFAGFDQSEADHELARLSELSQQLRQENASLRSRVAASERQLQIQRASYDDMVTQIKTLCGENASLKEDLAFFQTLMTPASKDGGVSINRFSVIHDAIPGEYRYRLLLLQTGPRVKEFQGRMQFVVNLQQDARKLVVTVPEADGPVDKAYQLNFKFYQRIDGTFKVAPDAVLKNVQIRVYENGSAEPRLRQSVTPS